MSALKYYLGIDTSNYTTSAAVCSEEGEVIAMERRLLPVAQGGCGLRQSDAVFAHTKQLGEVVSRLRAALPEDADSSRMLDPSAGCRWLVYAMLPCRTLQCYDLIGGCLRPDV